MATVLQIDELGLSLWRDGERLVASPGYITTDGKRAAIGNAAKAQVKLKPTLTEYKFWDKFGLDPLPRKNRLATTQADLAYMHLADVWQQASGAQAGAEEEVIVAVPGDFSKDQLALLLGMTKRLQMPVVGLIDAALAASHQPAPGRWLYHLDMHSHRLILTALEQSEELTIGQRWTNRELGLLRWREAWSLAVADAFINATRLDPMHNAQVEQQLFDRLFEWLEQLRVQNEIEAELSHGSQLFKATLTSGRIDQASARLSRELSTFVGDLIQQPATLQVHDHLLSLPGIAQGLQALPGVDVVATAQAPVFDVDLLATQTGTVCLFAAKPWLAPDDRAQHQENLSTFSQSPPTHILHDGIARGLGSNLLIGAADQADLRLDSGNIADQHLRLVQQGERCLAQPINGSEVLLNGRLMGAEQLVMAGDRLRLGQPGVELQLIAVER